MLFGASGLAAPVPGYFTHVWQTDEGLPANGISALVQTRDGYLWVGTYGGLARFDGVRFVVFNNNNTPQMYSRRVTSLFEDSTGTLWIGFETGGMVPGRGVSNGADFPGLEWSQDCGDRSGCGW